MNLHHTVAPRPELRLTRELASTPVLTREWSAVKLFRWQVRTTLLIGAVAPAIASFIMMILTYPPLRERGVGPSALPDFFVAFVCFAIPLGYAFGVVPALLTGAMYCGALTALPKLRSGALRRACLATLVGGLIGEAWFHTVMGLATPCYAEVAAFVAALLSLHPVPSRNRIDVAQPAVSADIASTTAR